MAIYIAQKEDLVSEYDDSGFAKKEALPGTYEGGIRNYKCFLKAGCQVEPEMYEDKLVLFFFGKGTGYITDQKGAYSIEELCFYVPEFNRTPYAVHATGDMEFMMCVVDMNQWDWKVYNASHVRLPFFRTVSKCIKYDQDCKGPHPTSWFVLTGQQLGRIMVGAVRAVGEGTAEKGHPAVEQWNYCVGDSDFELTVDGETRPHRSGEWSYVPAGLDHSLMAEPGKEVYYVWFEHFTKEKDFIVKPLPENF
ncbi:hypothetical protein [Enterocloster bolteae]|uniref:hypothetical protein n=1 Tax=Enterocloster bolteae TaxID=208479 RepID=UPI002A7F288C|nr:hypothetical protein [Enterocloster bolteae]